MDNICMRPRSLSRLGTMSRSMDLLSSILDVVQKIEATAPIEDWCNQLAQQIKRLEPFLEEVFNIGARLFTYAAVDTFKRLMEVLLRAYRVMQISENYNKLVVMFRRRLLSEEVSAVCEELQTCLSSVPWIELKISSGKQQEIEDVLKQLGNLRDEVDARGSLTDLRDFESKVTDVLRSHNMGGSCGKVMDELLVWLAERLDSDLKTIRIEWQEMKGWVKEIEHPELLPQLMLYLDSHPNNLCRDCSTNKASQYASKGIALDNLKRGQETHSPSIDKNLSGKATVTYSATIASCISRKPLAQVEELPSNQMVTISTPNQSPMKSISAYVNFLTSNQTMQVLKSLTQLTFIATYASGQFQIFLAGGVHALAKLLKSEDSIIVEKAAGVLESLTQELKGGDKHLKYEEREQICTVVTDAALDRLIFLVQFGKNIARLKAAKVIVNILVDQEIRYEVLRRDGIVRAFFSLYIDGNRFLIPDEAKCMCVQGLILLSGVGDSNGESKVVVLTTALIRLAEQGFTDSVVEESLVSLDVLVDITGPHICQAIQEKGVIPFLVHSVEVLSSENGKEAAIKVLSQMAMIEGPAQAIVDCGLVSSMQTLFSEASIKKKELTSSAISLLLRCVTFAKDKVVLMIGQDFMRALIHLLGLEEVSDTCKLNNLSVLASVCSESEQIRTYFLAHKGVEVLKNLTTVVEFRVPIASILRSITNSQVRHTEICQQGALEIIIILLEDESMECQGNAVVALQALMLSEGWSTTLDNVPLKRVVNLLRPTCAMECREAAVEVLSAFSLRNYNTVDFSSSETIKLLLNFVEHGRTVASKKKAAEVLVLLARTNKMVCTRIVDAEGLATLIPFTMGPGKDLKASMIETLAIFCGQNDNCRNAVIDVGGIRILLEALERGKMKEVAATALAEVVNDIPARKAALDAGFVESTIQCLLSKASFQCSTELIRGLVSVLKSPSTAVSVREAGGVKALVRVLNKTQAEWIPGKKLTAEAITKLCKLDAKSVRLVGQEGGVTSLMNLLKLENFEASDCLTEVDALEGLASVAEDEKNKLIILEECGIPLLISILTRGSPTVQELASDVILKLSREGPDNSEHDICLAMVHDGIAKSILDIIPEHVHSGSSPSPKTIHNAICIVRNLSLAGQKAREALLDEGEGVVKVLLQQIHQPQPAGTDVVKVAVIALERFMLERRGRIALIREGGIGILLYILQHRLGTPGQAKSFAIKILVMLAGDPQFKEACSCMFQSGVVPLLKDILEYGGNNECKRQATILLIILVTSGPRMAVCRAIREEGILPKLLDLQTDAECNVVCTNLLNLLKKFDKQIRKSM